MADHAQLQTARDESRVLLLAPAGGSESGACTGLLETERPDDQHVLQVAYDRTPATVVDDWQCQVGELPAAMAVVCPESLAGASAELPDGVYTTTVAADDLTGVGIAISRYLDRWEETRAPTTVCLDSLTAILDAAETERVFRFLHTVTGRFLAADATAHVHLDPTTQDEQTIATLRTLFDVVVEHTGDGWTVDDA